MGLEQRLIRKKDLGFELFNKAAGKKMVIQKSILN